MSPPSRAVSLALIVVATLLFGFVAGVAVVSADQSTAEDDWELTKNASMVAELDANGDAHWTISTTITLEDQNDTEAFQNIATAFENGERSQLGYAAFEAAVNAVDQTTQREMRIQNKSLSTSSDAEVEAGVGRLSVSFTWENFARQDGNELIIDDVLTTAPETVWLDGLYETQDLTIASPSEFGVRDANVGAQNGQLFWDGPQTFDETSLQAIFIGPGDQSNGSESPTEEAGTNLLFWGLLPVAALGVILAVYAIRRERLQLDIPPVLTPTANAESDDEGSAAIDDSENGAESVTEPAAAGVESQAESPDGAAAIDEELLSDEERVERLLEQNGGRMKQADIVKETDWSNAKVSQLLSSMEEADQIDKLRIGRENLISFPEEDITDQDG